MYAQCRISWAILSARASRLRRWASFTEDFSVTVPSMTRISFMVSRMPVMSRADWAAQVPFSIRATERPRRPWQARSRRKFSIGV